MRRLTFGTLALTAAGVLPPRTVQAQTVEELRAQVVQLEQQRQEADDLARRVEAALLPKSHVDTMAIGPVALVAQGDDLTLIRDAADGTLQRLLDHLGSDIDLLQGVEIYALVREHRIDLGLTSEMGKPRSIGLSRETEAADLADNLVRIALEALDMTQDRPFHDWLTVGTLTLRSAADFVRAYESLATSPFEASSKCLLGELGGCRLALGLAETSEPLLTWYSEADRRTLVENSGRPPERLFPNTAAMYDRCVEGDGESCSTFMKDRSIQPPLPTNVRVTLVQHALAVGGVGAYGRLYRAGGTMEERLTAASRVPGDSLIASWRAVLVDSAGHPTAVSWPLGLAAVFWAMAFSAMALRSTRWR